jgi:hypothetical protein
MNRHRQSESLAAAARAELPRVAVQWLAAARKPLEKLTRAALDPAMTDAAFMALVQDFSESLPGLFTQLDSAALADHMTASMGAAMGNGIAQRIIS